MSSTDATSRLEDTRSIVSEVETPRLFGAVHLLFVATVCRLALNRAMVIRVSIMAALLAYGSIVDPDTGNGGVPCLWRTLFGFECPGCGLSRAGALLLRGRFPEAAHANWLIFPFIWVSACEAVTLYFPSVVNSWRIQRWQN